MAGSVTPARKRAADRKGGFDSRAMFEFSTIVNGSLDLKFILGHFLLTLMGKLLSLRGIALLQHTPGIFTVESAKGMPREMIGREIRVKSMPRSIFRADSIDRGKKPWITFFNEAGITLLVPLCIQDKIVGVAGFAPRAGTSFSTTEKTYLRSLANIAAVAVGKGIMVAELQRVNRTLDGKIQELNTLFELGREFTIILDPDKLTKLLMFAVMGQIGAGRYLLCLERDGKMDVVASRLDARIPDTLCPLFHSLSEPVLVGVHPKKSDRELHETCASAGLQVLVPMRSQNVTKGIIALGGKVRGEGYSQSDLSFLTSLANLAIVSLENARLFKEALEKQRLEDELIIARDIQKGLLPKQIPPVRGFQVAAVNISSKQVGGDYYDVVPLDDHRVVLAIGDVSGKGTPASLLMANLQATIRALVPLGLTLPELTGRVNDLICESTSSDRFITFFWGILDTANRTLEYVSAGHNPPFLFHTDGSVERLEKGGLILGIMKNLLPYESGRVTFGTGDVLVMFTDGVSEAMSVASEEFGEERLEPVVRAALSGPPEAILDAVIDAVRLHTIGAPQSDDITMLVVKAARHH